MMFHCFSFFSELHHGNSCFGASTQGDVTSMGMMSESFSYDADGSVSPIQFILDPQAE
jgi:hypothetical protein